jgi:hypothetical protein
MALAAFGLIAAAPHAEPGAARHGVRAAEAIEVAVYGPACGPKQPDSRERCSRPATPTTQPEHA